MLISYLESSQSLASGVELLYTRKEINSEGLKIIMIKHVVIGAFMLVLGIALGKWVLVSDDNNLQHTPSNAAQALLNDNNQPGPLLSSDENSDLQSDDTLQQQLAEKLAKVPLNIRNAIEQVVNQENQFSQYASAYPLAMQANQKQIVQMIDTLMSMESNPKSKGLVGIFYMRFVDLSPINASEYFWRSMPRHSSQYRRVMYNLYHEWAWLDMEKALADITTNTPEEERENLISYLLQDEHYGDNEVLLALAQTFSERTRAAALLATARNGDNAAAFERIVALPKNSDARRHSLYRLVRQWAKEDPSAAIAQINQMKNSGDRQNLLATAISVWAETAPEQALMAAINLDEGNNLGYSALSTLARTDGVRAMELVEQYANQLDGSIHSQIMQTWASSDARSAANYLELKGGAAMKNGARQIAWHYTMQHPDEAYQWAERVGLLNNGNVAVNMGNALVQTDLAKAQSLFEQLPNSAARSGLFTNIVRQRSKADIADAYKWLSQYKDEPKYQDAHNNLLYEWTRKDPQQAIEIALTLEQNSQRANYLVSAASSWYERSPDVALGWAFDLPQGIERDQIVAHLAQKVSQSNIDEALDIANQIGNDNIRNQTVESIQRKRR